jgi:hypothetical protein
MEQPGSIKRGEKVIGRERIGIFGRAEIDLGR